jgi:hypothetical protein
MTTEQKTVEVFELPDDLKETLTAIADAKDQSLVEYWTSLKPDVQEAIINVAKRSKSKEEIKYEQLTIRVPVAIMDFLRGHEKDMSWTAKDYIEYNVIERVRADLDAGDVFVLSAKEPADGWQLNPIFKAILNEKIV